MHKHVNHLVLGLVWSGWMGTMLPLHGRLDQPRAAVAQAPNLPPPKADLPPIYFRTKSYRVRLEWRRGYPYLSINHNGWMVMTDAPAKILSNRGPGDQWTRYRARSGDYTAIVQMGPDGTAAIAVSLAGKPIIQEVATFSTATPKPSPQPQPTATNAKEEVYIFSVQTPEYAVRVYRHQGSLWLNLYDKQTQKILVRRGPATERRTTDSTIYQYDGEASIQARENAKGARSLLILRDNAIQYRGEGF